MSDRTSLLYEFGPYRLEVSEHRLLRGEEIIPLSPKVFETLLVLVENSGHVLERDELMRTLWPDSFVEESSLTQNISLLRKALGESGRFIETVPKHGYRFVAPVKAEANGNGGSPAAVGVEIEKGEAPDAGCVPSDKVRAEPPPALSKPSRPRRGRNVALACGAALLLVVAGVTYFRERPGGRDDMPDNAADGRVLSLAVLPFKPLGSDGRDEFLGLGIADALVIKLSDFRQLTVRPTSSVFRYAGRDYDTRTVGRELGVDAVLDGTVRHSGDRVRVTVLLLRLRDGEALWSGEFDEPFTNIFALQDSVSERVVEVLQLQLASGPQRLNNKRFTEDAEAYRYYTMGLYFWNKRTKEGLSKAIDYFQKAVEKDPNYALAHAALADTYALTIFFRYDILPPREARQRAKAAATTALALDDTLAEAHAAMAMVRADFERDLGGAEESFTKAILLNPNSAVVHLRYGSFLFFTQLRLDEAIKHLRRAQELDPLSQTINSALAMQLDYSGQYDEAIKHAKLALEIEPESAWGRNYLGLAYESKGMYEEAAAEYGKLAEAPAYAVYGKTGLAIVYARTGREREARRLLSEFRRHLTETLRQPDGRAEPFDLPYQVALIHTALGEKDEAFLWLERAVEARAVSRVQLRHDPHLAPLRQDARLELLLLRYPHARAIRW